MWRNTCCSVNEIGPIFSAVGGGPESASPSDLKNMAFVIIVRNSSDMQQEILWTRVNELLVGREKTDTQRWSLVSFFRMDEEKSCLKATRSSRPATGKILSTMPSSSSQANQRLHKKNDLQS